MPVVLATEKLCKTVRVGGEEKAILKDIDVEIASGDSVAIMGPSGSGKSTFLYNASGMDRPTSGRVRFCDDELSSLSEKELSAMRLTRMGFVFQNGNLLKNLNIFDNVVLSAYMAKRESRRSIDAKAAALMERMGISSIARNGIAQASGGQLQRASLCRALMNAPELLFCDEPTGALNSASAREILDILMELNREGMTMLIATHDVKVASRANRALFIHDGRIGGRLELGVYRANDSTEREARLYDWLLSMGW